MNIQKMTFAVLALGGSAAVSAAAGMAHTTAQLPDASVLPQDVIQVSPLVPRMGEHWANPQTLPLGPIYCVHEGKIVCFEFMISQADFEAGKSWPALTGIKNMPPVDHIDVVSSRTGTRASRSRTTTSTCFSSRRMR